MRIWDYIVEGGPIMYLLLILNIIGVTIILWKSFSFFSYRTTFQAFGDQILRSFLDRMKDSKLENSVKHEVLKDEIGHHILKLESGLNTVKIIASIAPLMGLLGTVTGILSAFQVISQSGLKDPTLFAGGISTALITTVGGLIVAIPHFIGHNYLIKALDDLEDKIENYLIPKLF
jgi:biopolymer transport protein ExbB